MRPLVLVLLSLMLALVACGLSSGNESPTAVPIIRTPTSGVIIVTNTPAPATATPTQQSSGSSSGGNTTCTVRTDWPIYTVVAGDTLGTIAQRTGSTVNQLTTANCLANPNSISVGQQIRVPRSPAPPTATQSSVPTNGYVTVSSYLYADAGHYLLESGKAITLTWPEAPRGASRVDFWLNNQSVVGTDSNPLDGATANWTVPANITGNISAVAYKSDGGTMQYSYLTAVSSGNLPPGNECVVRNNLAMPVTVYTQPVESAGVFGQLSPFAFERAVGKTANGWIAIFPGVANAGAFGIYRIKWLAPSSNNQLLGPCGSLPVIPIDVASSGCTITANTDVTVYSQPNQTAAVFGTLSSGMTAEVMVQTSDGWYGIDTGTASAGDFGAYKARWIPASGDVTFNGTCGNVPLIPLGS